MGRGLTALTIAAAAELIRDTRLSPVELTQAHLDRIQAIEPLLNSYITVTGELALEQARAAETEIMRGAYRGALHGIPIALKDLFPFAGVATTAGSRFLGKTVDSADCAVASKLRSAGAVNLGKTNMHEWAFGVINDNPHYGACHNPWDTARSPGGSSGGSAAALAAELCMGALGSDTRGSIRIPASLCGVVGLKPTYGRVSLRGVVPLSWSLDHVGPMARTVKDVALLLQAIAGWDEGDPVSVDAPVDDYVSRLDAGILDCRIGVLKDGLFDEAEPQISAAVEAAADVLVQLGARRMQNVPYPSFDTRETSRFISGSEAAAFHEERLQTQPQDFGEDVRARLSSSLTFRGTEYASARLAQLQLIHAAKRLFEHVDLLVAPTTPIVAPRLDDVTEVENARIQLSWFTAPFNMAGLPAISIPCGFTANGLPIGLQLVARHWGEAQLLRAAYAYEQATDLHKRRPAIG